MEYLSLRVFGVLHHEYYQLLQHVAIDCLSEVDCGGWSFHCRERGFKVYPAGDDARNATDVQLRTRPVFSTREAPFLSNASQYLMQDYFTLLALHMPVLTPAMGRPEGATFSDTTPLSSIDMVPIKDNGWGRDSDVYRNRWLHSDVKNMAYFYVNELFKMLNSLTKGGEQ